MKLEESRIDKLEATFKRTVAAKAKHGGGYWLRGDEVEDFAHEFAAVAPALLAVARAAREEHRIGCSRPACAVCRALADLEEGAP